MNDNIVVGIADMKMAQHKGTIITHALGSCIGICLYDPILKLGAMIHIMLPINIETGRKSPMKYADTGLAETLNQLRIKGVTPARLTAKIAGGAKMFEIAGSTMGNIGQRNIESVLFMLKKHGIRLVGNHTGGTTARTLSMDVSTGDCFIRSYGKPEIKF